jgi:hypothetical protein
MSCKLAQAFDRAADGLEIGQHAAQPALIDIWHGRAQRFLLDRIARRALGADEQHGTAVGYDLLDEGGRISKQRLGLLEVDDVDLVAFAENERFHLRVPEAGLMSEMDARLQHLSH